MDGKKVRIILLLFIFGLPIGFPLPAFSFGLFVTGNTIYDRCNSNNLQDSNYCAGIIETSFDDYIMMINDLYGSKFADCYYSGQNFEIASTG